MTQSYYNYYSGGIDFYEQLGLTASMIQHVEQWHSKYGTKLKRVNSTTDSNVRMNGVVRHLCMKLRALPWTDYLI